MWVASLAHAGNNMVLFLLTGQLLSGGSDGLGAIATMVLTTAPVAALAGWLAWRSRRRARALNAPPVRPVLHKAGDRARDQGQEGRIG